MGFAARPKWGPPSHFEKAFWAPDFFFKNENSALELEDLRFLTTEEIRTTWKKLFPEASSEAPAWDLLWEPGTPSDFFSQLEQLQFLFQTHILKKAVPIVIDTARPRDGQIKTHLEQHALYFLNALTELPDSLMPYGLLAEDWMLGATPEVLVQKQGDLVTTHALAGTTLDMNQDLLADPKERFEHQLVIDEIRTVLQTEGSVTVGDTTEKKLPRLKHLHTPIEVTGCKTSLFNLGKKLHPTPALGGFPRKAAWEWLEQQTTANPRERFGAPFGFWDESGDGLLVVGIRNIQVIENELRLCAGCGVVLQSEAEREWREVAGKKDSVRAIWGVL